MKYLLAPPRSRISHRCLPVLLLALLLTVAFTSGLPRTCRAGDNNVQIRADDSMKYDVTAIDAMVGQTVHITLVNNGRSPKTGMAHNVVILAPGTDWKAFVASAATQSTNGYLPVAQADHILAATKLLGPGESDTLDFTPAIAGTYEFVCTFPAHAILGMRGTITVK